MKMHIPVKGQHQVLQRMKHYRRTIPEGVRVGLYWLAEKVMDESQRLTPVDTGELRDSAFIAEPEVHASASFQEMGYGAEHAIYVHEDTTASHTSGEAKFFEKAMMSVAKGAMHKVAKRAERAIERGETWARGRYPTRPRS